MRERKRFMAFEVLSAQPVKGYDTAYRAIERSLLRFSGIIGLAGAGLKTLPGYWNQERQRGLIRVSHQFTSQLKAAIALARKIDNQDVIIRSLGTSGILKKANEKYIAA